MNSSMSSPSLFEIPQIKNAKVVKTEIKPYLHNIVYNYAQPLSFEIEPYPTYLVGKSYQNNTYHHVYIFYFIPILHPIGKDTYNNKYSLT